MNTVITFTPAQLVAFIGALFAFIASIGAGVAVIAKLITKIRKPELEQNQKIADLDRRVGELEKQRGDDATFHKEQEQTNKIILRTLQALLNLSLGVENAEALKVVANELNEFLLNK